MKRRRNWLKICLRIIALLLVAGSGLSIMSYLAIRRTPEWYQPDRQTEAQRNRTASRLENLLSNLVSWGQKKHVESTAAIEMHNVQQAHAVLSHKAEQSFEISFTDAELNALFNKWQNTNDRRAWFEQYVEDPQIVIRGKQMIFVGKVKSMDTVVSLVFEPKLTEAGQLDMKLVHVLGGVLPLPDALWSGHRAGVERTLRQKLPLYQRDANIASDGVANGDAASAAMNQMLLSTLQYKPAAPVIFVPIDWLKLTRSLPVKITSLSIHDHTVEMNAEQMDGPERNALLEQLKRTEEDPVDPPGKP